MFWFFPLAYVIIIFYLTIKSFDKEKSETSYFFSNYNTKWYQSLISIVATETSVATILIFPASGFKKDFSILYLCLGYIVGRIIVAKFYLIHYHKFDGISLYDFFSYKDQKILSFSYLLAKYISGGVRFYLAGFGLAQITPFETHTWLIIITLLTGIYSISGGLNAVIKTDIIQGILIFLSGIFFLCILFSQNFQKVEFDFSEIVNFDFNNILIFVGSLLLTISSHGADQDNLQRVFSIKEIKDAKKSLILSGFTASLIILIFFFIGFYLKSFTNLDFRSPFLSYISNLHQFNENPYTTTFIKGIFFILLIAASMSTIDSSIHTTAIIWKSILKSYKNFKNSYYSFFSLIFMFLFGNLFIFISQNKDFLSLALGSMNYINGTLFSVATIYIIFKMKLNFKFILSIFLINFFTTLILTEIIKTPWYLTTTISFLFSLSTGIIIFKFQK